MSFAFTLSIPFIPSLRATLHPSLPVHLSPCPQFSQLHTRPPLSGPAVRATLSPLTSLSPDSLAPFAEAVRGEWTGYEALFNLLGQPQPIPDYYIPEQFIEWGLIPHGFETNHSTILRNTTLFLKFFRVLPAVTLFADHVDLEEELARLDMSEVGNCAFADGSFTVGKSAVLVKRESKLQKWPAARFCVRDPREGERKALHVKLKFNFEKACLVEDINVILEKWSCEHCDGADIEGSSGYIEGWAVEQSMERGALKGTWAIEGGKQVERRVGEVEEEGRQMYMPKGIDVGIRRVGNELVVSVGWLVDGDNRIVVRRTYDDKGIFMGSDRVVERRVQ